MEAARTFDFISSIYCISKDSTPPVMDWTDEAIEKGYAAADGAISFEAQRNTKAFILFRLNSSETVNSYEKK